MSRDTNKVDPSANDGDSQLIIANQDVTKIQCRTNEVDSHSGKYINRAFDFYITLVLPGHVDHCALNNGQTLHKLQQNF